MAAIVAGLNRVPETMRAPIQSYAELVREIVGDNARSLALFGSVVARSFDPSRHTAHSVLVVDKVDLRTLRRLAAHGLSLGKSLIAAPLIMTPRYIAASLDTFPLELIEIQQNHLTLFGDDHFHDLNFKDEDVRYQCERELKVLLMGLRQGLLAAAGREKYVAGVQATISEQMVRTLRGMLWLKGRHEGQSAEDVVAEVENLYQLKLPGLRTALDTGAMHSWEQFDQLYSDVDKLGDIVDAW